MDFTLYQTIPCFYDVEEQLFEIIVEKEKFPTMFLKSILHIM